MALSFEPTGEYKITKSRKIAFGLSMALCILTMTSFGYALVFGDESKGIWEKIGLGGVTIFIGFIWFGITYAYTIADKGNCSNCGIAIKDNHIYCVKCDLQKENELRHTSDSLYCIVCDEEIESVDKFKDHYLKNHELEFIAESICRPSFSKIRITDALFIKKK